MQIKYAGLIANIDAGWLSTAKDGDTHAVNFGGQILLEITKNGNIFTPTGNAMNGAGAPIKVEHFECPILKNVGDTFYVHFDYMDDDEVREEVIASIVWSEEDGEYLYANTPDLKTPCEVYGKADTYTCASQDERDERKFHFYRLSDPV